MNSLVSKDEPLKASIVHVGYLILKKLEKTESGRMSLTECAAYLVKHGVTKSRPMTFSLIFLYVSGLIDFKAPYLYKVKL